MYQRSLNRITATTGESHRNLSISNNDQGPTVVATCDRQHCIKISYDEEVPNVATVNGHRYWGTLDDEQRSSHIATRRHRQYWGSLEDEQRSSELPKRERQFELRATHGGGFRVVSSFPVDPMSAGNHRRQPPAASLSLKDMTADIPELFVLV
ncbi:hypothetical protein BC567DRAFT_221171 [Phyllosticta citribraziliensis]